MNHQPTREQHLPTQQQPLPNIRIHPTAIRVKDGTYYLYATEDIHNLPIFKSKDLVHWEEIGTAFTEETRPNFVDNNPEGKKAALWAPEIRYIKGKYRKGRYSTAAMSM